MESPEIDKKRDGGVGPVEFVTKGRCLFNCEWNTNFTTTTMTQLRSKSRRRQNSFTISAYSTTFSFENRRRPGQFSWPSSISCCRLLLFLRHTNRPRRWNRTLWNRHGTLEDGQLRKRDETRAGIARDWAESCARCRPVRNIHRRSHPLVVSRYKTFFFLLDYYYFSCTIRPLVNFGL